MLVFKLVYGFRKEKVTIFKLTFTKVSKSKVHGNFVFELRKLYFITGIKVFGYFSRMFSVNADLIVFPISVIHWG